MTDMTLSDVSHMDKLMQLTKALSQTTIAAGVPVDNGFLNMVALVNETGKQIVAKNHPYLVIPTGNADGKKPGEIAGLYKRGHSLGVNDASQPNGYRVMFVLKQSVNIPSRPFLRLTLKNNVDDWAEILAQALLKATFSDQDEQFIYKTLGDQMVKDIQNTMDHLMEPHNAPLTVERKGFDDPLIDTKTLRNSISWFTYRR